MNTQDFPPSPSNEGTPSEPEAKGHIRTHSPFESPSRAATSRPPIPSTPGGTHYGHQLPSTPGHNFYAFAPGTPRGNYGSQHGAKVIAELNTPVISNANVKYVDDDQDRDKSAHLAKLGLPTGRRADMTFPDKSTNYGIPAKSLAPRTKRPPLPHLAMPSGSDDSSLEDNFHHDAPAMMGGAAQENILRPIELKPNRFHSFQGSSQYKKSSHISHPMTLTPAREHNATTSPGATANSGQYIPVIRGAHGVRELSDTKDLDAIFKADRTTPRTHTTSTNHKIVSPMSVDDEDDDEEQRQESFAHHSLGGAIPIDDRQWSIPSIRLANHVNNSGMDGSVHSYQTFFSDEEDYTDDGGSSFDDSFLGCEDDDVSLSSKESYDQVRRWRRISGVLRRSGDQMAALMPNEDDDVMMTPPPQVTRTVPTAADLDKPADMIGTFLLEQRFGDIAIDTMGPFTNSPKQLSTTMYSPPPILNITAPSRPIDDNAVDYAVPARTTTGRRRRHKKKGRSHSSAAAFEWIHHLQLNNVAEGGQITEAASSKFLTGTGNKVDSLENLVNASHDVTKALGMPHPLCRSSTIEAGGFAYGVDGDAGWAAQTLS